MLQKEHSAILSTFIKLPFVIKIFVLSIFEWPFRTGFTVGADLTELMRKMVCAFVIHIKQNQASTQRYLYKAEIICHLWSEIIYSYWLILKI